MKLNCSVTYYMHITQAGQLGMLKQIILGNKLKLGNLHMNVKSKAKDTVACVNPT